MQKMYPKSFMSDQSLKQIHKSEVLHVGYKENKGRTRG